MLQFLGGVISIPGSSASFFLFALILTDSSVVLCTFVLDLSIKQVFLLVVVQRIAALDLSLKLILASV